MALQLFISFWLMTIFAAVSGDIIGGGIHPKCVQLEGKKFGDVNETAFKLQLHGSTIKFSNIPDKWFNFCGGKTRFLEFFARDTIIIDKDFHNGGITLHVIMIGPELWVIGEKTIHLTGADGKKHEEPYARNGEPGLPGDDGLSGLPAESGGIFIGISDEVINGDMLHIFADGGNGAPGQHGGNGGVGQVPELPDSNDINNNDKVILVEPEDRGFFSFLSSSCTYVLQKLTAGGNGGNGGKGGNSGNAGQIFWHQLNGNSKIYIPPPMHGQTGLDGVGGKGGEGSGKSITVERPCSHKKELTAIPSWRLKLETVASLRNGVDGEIGNHGNITTSMESKDFREIASVVNDYKFFVRLNLTEKLNTFYDKLINNEDLNKNYGTLELVDELKGLETQFCHLTGMMNSSPWPWYINLGERIEKYSAHRLDSESDEDYVVALGYAYTNILTRSSFLHENVIVIVDLQKYLNSVINEVNYLKDDKMRYYTADQFTDDFMFDIEGMIEGIEKIIEIQFKKDINKLNKLMKEESSNLVDEAMNLKNESNSKNYTLKNSMQQQALFTIMETVFESVLVLIPGGKAAAAIASTSIEVGKNFLPQYSRDGSTEEMIVQAETSFSRDFESIRNFKHDQFKILKEQIEFLKDEEKAMESNHTNLVDRLKSLEDQLRNGNGTKAVERMGIISKLEIFLALKELDNKTDGTLKQIFESLENDMKNLQKYLDRILDEFIPVLERINRDLDSNMQPDISKWGVQAALKNVKWIVKQFTREFEVANEMNPLIKSLEDIMNLFTNTFNRIRHFQQEQKLVAHVRRLSRVHEPKIEALRNPLLETRTRIRKNLAIILYGRMLNAFKQVAFPFIGAYGFNNLFKPATLESLTSAHENPTRFFELILENIMKMKDELETNKQIFIKGRSNDRSSDGRKILKEIYKWKNETHHEMISNLLDGHEVILSPEARKFPAFAVKFRELRINLRAKDEKNQEALKKKLDYSQWEMIHEGNSYYTCGNKMYLKFHSPLTFVKYFNGEDPNNVAHMIAGGDHFLSPFATWRVKFSPWENARFRIRKNYLAEFKNKVDLVMEATSGSFLEKSHQKICEEYTNLSEYYEEYVPLSNVTLI